MAMVAARGGIPRLTERAAMSAALPVCSGSKVSVLPAAVMVHLGLATLWIRYRAPNQPPVTTTASTSSAVSRRRRRCAADRGRESARVGPGRLLGMGSGPQVVRLRSEPGRSGQALGVGRRWSVCFGASGSVVVVERGVQGDASALAVAGLDGTGHAVADEEHVARPRQLLGLDRGAVGQR